MSATCNPSCKRKVDLKTHEKYREFFNMPTIKIVLVIILVVSSRDPQSIWRVVVLHWHVEARGAIRDMQTFMNVSKL